MRSRPYGRAFSQRSHPQKSGSLTIASLQDTSDYASRSFQAGGSVTIGPAPGGSLSLSGQKVDASYASVTEQSGIVAAGRTRLVGGAIATPVMKPDGFRADHCDIGFSLYLAF